MTQIKHRYAGEILFELKDKKLRETLVRAVKEKTNLSSADLSAANLSAANLSAANLSVANLSCANFSGADLSGADLSGADLSGADLYAANLKGAKLEGAKLGGAKLDGAKLEGAKLEGANLEGANLKGANLKGANLSRVNLSESYLSRANLSRVNLFEADLSRASLEGADLNEANLGKANLNEANLSGVNLSGANLTKAVLQNVNFKRSDLNNTIFGLTDLSTSTGLETAIVSGKCVIDFETLKKSPNLPHTFLHKLGISELALGYVHDLTNASPIKMFPVFLSHSWGNKPFARMLYESLIENHIHCWFDEKKTKPGDKIISVISEGIKNYDKMILVCSKESLTSWWVERELERILSKEREYNNGKKEKEKVNLLIPVCIDDYVFDEWDSPWAEEVKRYIIGDFRDWTNSHSYEKSLKRLINAFRVEPIIFIPPSFLPPKK